MKLLIILALSIFSTQIEAEEYPRISEGVFKQYDGKRLDLIQKFLPYDPVIFEAGGHYGEDTVRLQKKWPKGKVITFEPNPNAFKLLVEKTSEFENIFSYNLAVNNYNGKATLHVCYGTTGDDPIFEGASSLLSPSKSMEIHYKGPKVEVPCVVLDDWCKENHVDHIDFMWLDLEGLELQILKSSPDILSTVKVIYTETNFYEFRKETTQFKNLKDFLESAGFVLVAHWYNKGLQGDAVFIKKILYSSIFDNK